MKNIRSWIEKLEKEAPEEVVRVKREVKPGSYEVTALLQRLENMGKSPMLIFERIENTKGEDTPYQFVINMFGTQTRMNMAMDLPKNTRETDTALEYARREESLTKPRVVPRSEAPVLENVKKGKEVDLGDYPILKHNEGDAGPYLVHSVVCRGPGPNRYNLSYHRMQIKDYKGPNITGIHASPRHLWQAYQESAEKGQPLPIAVVVGHHPSYYLATASTASVDVDEYEVAGGIMNEPLRVTESTTWGKDLMIPAEAEFVFEGRIMPDRWDVEAPFGEFLGYLGGERWRPEVEILAVEHRSKAIWSDFFVSHKDHMLFDLGIEAGIYSAVKAVAPAVKSVTSRMGSYIVVQIKKQTEGDAKRIGMAVLGRYDIPRLVIVVDEDIDPTNPADVMWAITTRTNFKDGVDVSDGVKTHLLETSTKNTGTTTTMIIDATKYLRPPFHARSVVPQEIVDGLKIEEYIPAKELERLPNVKAVGLI